MRRLAAHPERDDPSIRSAWPQVRIEAVGDTCCRIRIVIIEWNLDRNILHSHDAIRRIAEDETFDPIFAFFDRRLVQGDACAFIRNSSPSIRLCHPRVLPGLKKCLRKDVRLRAQRRKED